LRHEKGDACVALFITTVIRRVEISGLRLTGNTGR